ncbi:MAG: prepilin-type N-terminal cleavage/methylation domain-containing protein [Pyrinomonadaceae bacterium]|nr:prepilin-type N-terminal cleavage/methylation domain-containing protein [Pyrinomonadaceae bacterium]
MTESTVQLKGQNSPPTSSKTANGGFTLIEVSVAMVVVLIALLGVFMTITYAITWNAGNNSRAQALAILQEEVERLRSAKFTPYFTDDGLRGGIQSTRTVTSPNGGVFSVRVQVDNDPAAAGIQTEADVPDPTLKEVEILVRLENPSPGWQTAIPATIVMRRVRSN